jgi:hypothetical protein
MRTGVSDDITALFMVILLAPLWEYKAVSSPASHTTARRLAKAVALAVVSAVVTYLFLELVAFRLLLPYAPLELHGHLPREIRVLAQSSKRSTIPRDYIALVGDSYAQGYGDWLLDSNPKRNAPFHSAHVLHRATGRDVITFGASGAGSLTGLVAAPIGQLRYLDASWLYAVERPRVIVVYFYAGNDFNNNLSDLKQRFYPNFAGRDVRDPRVFRRFLTAVVLGGNASWVEGERGLSLTSRLFLLRTLGSVWLRPPAAAREPWSVGEINRVIVGGRPVAVPDALQSPGLELDDTEVALAAYVFEEALRYLQAHFPAARVRIAYIPSPLECYELASPQVDIQTYEGRRARYRIEELDRHHGIAVTTVRQIAERNGMAFVDATPHLRAVTRDRLVHGPRDWKHLNRAGYEALARAVLTVL